MDDQQQSIPPETLRVIQRMIDAGEPEDNIAAVIQHMKDTPSLATGRKANLMDMFRPTDPNTGQGLRTPIPKNAPKVAATLAGMATQFIPGLGVVGRLASGVLAGSAGTAADEAMHGEPFNLGDVAMGGAEQGTIALSPEIAGPVGSAVSSAGRKLAGFTAGKLTPYATGAAAFGASSGLPYEARALAALAGKEYGPSLVEGAARATGRGVEAAGDALGMASKATTSATSWATSPGTKAMHSGSGVPMLPDALRKIQLLVRALSQPQKQQ